MKYFKAFALTLSFLVVLVGVYFYANGNTKEETKSSATVTEVVTQQESVPSVITEVPAKVDASEEGALESRPPVSDKAVEQLPLPTPRPNPNDEIATTIVDPRNAEIAIKKVSVLQEFPQVSDIGIAGDLTFLVYAKIDSTDLVGDMVYMQQANGLYRFFRVDVLNRGKKPQTVDVSMFTLIAPDGTTYEPDPTATVYAKAHGFQMERLNPGTEAQGYVAFDLPPDISFPDLALRVRNGDTHVDLSVVRE